LPPPQGDKSCAHSLPSPFDQRFSGPLQQQEFNLGELSEFAIGDNAFAASDPQDINILSVFVQTGYLTIKSYNDPLYTLDFPNYEVKKSSFDSVVDRYSCIKSGMGQSFMVTLTGHLNAGRLDDFFESLKAFFANIPYDLDVEHEKHYHALFYATFTLLGFDVEAEVRTNIGRIDCVLQTDDRIYIIEFKLNDTKEAALQQIHDKQYAQKYQQRLYSRSPVWIKHQQAWAQGFARAIG
jgi:Holliday junction resolvase-like predicted endonuclease